MTRWKSNSRRHERIGMAQQLFPRLSLAFVSTVMAGYAFASQTLYLNGTILTGRDLLQSTPERVTALAVDAGRIAAVGTDAQILSRRKAGDPLVDLHGAFVVPGFNDAHVHLAQGGMAKLQVDLTYVQSLGQMLAHVQHAARTAAPGAWIQGFGWDHTLWKTQRLPGRADLDRVTAGHPILLERVDGHIAVVNSEALQVAGIDANTPDPAGGVIDRDSSGYPTGILRETAMEQMKARIPAPSADARRKALQLACAEAVRSGVTSAQDNSTWDDFLVFEQMQREGRLPIRIDEWLAFSDSAEILARQRATHPASDLMLRTGMLKGFMDGSLGSRTAALSAPYSDDPATSGVLEYEQGTLVAMTIERARMGFQVGFHAIGDRGVAVAVDAFDAARRQGIATARFRIEHLQVVAPNDFDRLANMQIIASMQPSHLLSDMRWARARLGTDRARFSYAWKSVLDHGIALAFGTDFPVEPITPFRGLYAAVTRKSEPGVSAGHGEAYFPEERLTLVQALYAYTQGSAFAQRLEHEKGILAPGYLADFVVLDRDLLIASPEEILQTRVLRTIVGGKTVYRSH
jgi:predicted amidohydrolase YtcJ